MNTQYLRRFVWRITVIACLVLPFIQVSSALGQVDDPYKTHKKLNPVRFTNSCQVIQGYLNELYTNLDFALKSGNEAAAEYLSQNVIVPGFPNYGGSIRDPLVQQEINTVYQTFTNKVGTIGEQFNTRVSTLSPRRDVAQVSCDMTELLNYEMMYKSPFVLSEPNTETDSRAFYDAIVWRNASNVNALKDYIKEVEKIYKKVLARTDIQRIDNDVLNNLDDLAILLYKATTRVRYFQLDWAMQKYARDSQIYAAYTNFYNRCWNQYYGFYASQQGFDLSYCYSTEPLIHPGNNSDFTRYEDVRTLTRTSWSSCNFRIDVTTFQWAPGQGWRRAGYELHMGGWWDNFASLVGVNYMCWNGYIGTPKGRYDIGAIAALVAHDIEIIYPSRYGPDPGGNIAEIQAGMVPAACSYFASYNSYYTASKAAMEQLRDRVNSILVNYKSYLPYTRLYSLVNEHLAHGEDASVNDSGPLSYYWCPTLDFDLTYYPAFSVAASNDGPKTLPASFTLSKTLTDFPADGGVAQYRWIITHIPQSSAARSPRYVMGQVISTGSTAVLDLRGTGTADDLASNPPYGDWEVTLEVNNNRPQLYTTQTAIQANRIILGVIHDDKQIQLTTAIDPSSTTQYSGYYLELSNENANVYWNYDDDNCPVDDMGLYYTPPCQSRIFSLIRDPSYKPLFGTGALYDGVYGSTDLVSNEKSIFSLGVEAAKLYSASFSDNPESDLRGHRVSIQVKVYDPQVTELFLGYGDDWKTRVKILRRNFPTGVSPYGSYYIKQWIDYYTWSNPWAWLPNSRTAFTMKKKSNSVPDWMERCAEEAIEMGFPESIRDISGISVHKGEEGSTNPPFSRTLGINPFREMMRVNGPDSSGYGFWNAHLNDGTARHEAFHQFYFWQNYPLNRNRINDRDFDFLPNKIKGEDVFWNDRYFYMFDSGSKSFCGGPTGPSSLTMPTTFSQTPFYSYGGDSTRDDRLGFWEPIGAGSVYALKYGKTLRKAVLKYNWNFHQSTPIVHPPFPDRVIIVGGETHYMYRNPIYLFLQDKFPDLQVGTYYADPFLLARKAKVFGSDDCEVEKIALTPAVATSELSDLLAYPKLQVIFPTTSVYWTQLFDYWETSRGYRIDDCIYYNFAFRPPSPDQEYDACMSEPGVYIGVGGRPPGP